MIPIYIHSICFTDWPGPSLTGTDLLGLCAPASGRFVLVNINVVSVLRHAIAFERLHRISYVSWQTIRISPCAQFYQMNARPRRRATLR